MSKRVEKSAGQYITEQLDAAAEAIAFARRTLRWRMEVENPKGEAFLKELHLPGGTSEEQILQITNSIAENDKARISGAALRDAVLYWSHRYSLFANREQDLATDIATFGLQRALKARKAVQRPSV